MRPLGSCARRRDSVSARSPPHSARSRRAAAASSGPAATTTAVANIAAVFDTGAEAVEGSTRLAAGTAQKAALSVISTLAAAELGLVHRGLMINVRPENAKLKVRARTIVERLASVGREAAEAALVEAGSDVATAVVVAAGPLDAAAARRLLAQCGGDLAKSLSRLRAQERTSTQARA